MRDFAGEMKALIQAATRDGDYIAPLVANRIITRLRANDEELLIGWLMLNAAQLLTETIGTMARSHRSHVRAMASRSRFAVAARAYEETGDSEGLQGFMTTEYVLADGSRQFLARLTHEDLLFVADDYRNRAKVNAFEGAFARALAARVTSGTVGENLSEEEVRLIRKGLIQDD